MDKNGVIIDGNLWRLTSIKFDEIMEQIVLSVAEYSVFDHKRIKGCAKYRIIVRNRQIVISLMVPQVRSTLEDSTIEHAMQKVADSWKNYLQYALEEKNISLINFNKPISQEETCVLGNKLTLEEVFSSLNITEQDYTQVFKHSPY